MKYEFDFDKLRKMYEEDPEAWEEYRKAAIEDSISLLPEEHQLRARQFQFQIDAKMRKIVDPKVRAAKANTMMIDSLLELNEKLNELIGKKPAVPAKPKSKPVLVQTAQVADIAQFRKNRQENIDKEN